MAPMRPSGGPPPPRMDGGFRPRAPMMHPGPRPRMPGPGMPLSEEEFYNIKKKLIEKEERRLVKLLEHATCTVALASLKSSSALDCNNNHCKLLLLVIFFRHQLRSREISVSSISLWFCDLFVLCFENIIRCCVTFLMCNC